MQSWRRWSVGVVVAWGLGGGGVGSAMAQGEGGARVTGDVRATEVVARHGARWTAPGERIPWGSAVDAPLLGNGDVAVAIGGTVGRVRFHLAKNDFWRLRSQYGEAGPRPFGELEVAVEGMDAAEFSVEQRFVDGVTTMRLATDGRTVVIESWVAATENLLVVEVAVEGWPTTVEVGLRTATGDGAEVEEGREDDVAWGERRFTKGVDIPTAAAVAMRVLGAGGSGVGVEEGSPVTIVAGMTSRFEGLDVAGRARELVQGIAAADVAELRRRHEAWWAAYWERAWVEIGVPEIERAYYQGLYTLGSCSRDPRFPPSIFGSWITTDAPSWHGDYHLNYNHVAPYYGLYSANRIAQADPEDAPLLDFMDRGGWYAREATGTRGVLFPVGIGPLGIETTRHSPHGEAQMAKGGLFFGQKSNAAYCLVNFAARWYATYELAYARRTYPLVLDVVEFWEDYLRFEDGRYVIHDDAVHEGSGENFNSIVTLALVRNAFALALDMGRELDVDGERREKWEHVLAHLSDYAVQERDGVEVFRYTERGTDWWGDNTLGIQHIFPAGQVGLDSDPELLRLAHNTIRVMDRWLDFNGSNSFFPAAARVGFDPETILARLAKYVAHTYPNGFQLGNPHGIENCSTVHNTVNEMLCTGHGGVLRVFPDWPRARDAAFHHLRVQGAFLVDSELRDGEVQYVRIESERGRDCVVVNPWPGRPAIVLRAGRAEWGVEGERFFVETAPGEVVLLEAQ